jgi:pimeloyl-ACP methyl ester carboxylesterase
VVWDSPVVDYTPVKYEYGFFSQDPILSQLQKTAGTRIGAIKQALTYYRDDLNLAATQAIVIGHSMGGILARVWASEAYNPDYRRAENFMQGDIDRLLTLRAGRWLTLMGTLITWFTGSRFGLAVGKWAAIALAVLLFLLSLRRAGERAGRMAAQLENREKANEIQRRMLETAARRPRDRGELVERLRDGES